MIYGKYRYVHVRDAAWQTLIDYNVTELPVSLLKICRAAGIKVIRDSVAHMLNYGEFGISVKQGDAWYIIFDDSDTPQRIRFTIAHELGHIFLGHEMKYGYHTRKYNIVKPSDETEADMFAARLLAPACVLWGIGVKTAEDIAELCNISYTAARIRARRLETLRSRGKFLSSQLERRVYDNFSEFIQNYRKGEI